MNISESLGNFIESGVDVARALVESRTTMVHNAVLSIDANPSTRQETSAQNVAHLADRIVSTQVQTQPPAEVSPAPSTTWTPEVATKTTFTTPQPQAEQFTSAAPVRAEAALVQNDQAAYLAALTEQAKGQALPAQQSLESILKDTQ